MSDISLNPIPTEEQLGMDEATAQGKALYEQIAHVCNGYPMHLALGAMFMLIHACVEAAPEEIRPALLAGIAKSCSQIMGGSDEATH